MGEIAPVAVLEAKGLASRTRVEFRLDGDFYSHEIWQLGGDQKIKVLSAVQDADAPHIASYTQLQQQASAIFLTGANGPNHWSMSVHVGEVRFPGDKQFALDDLAGHLRQRYGLNAPPVAKRSLSFQFLYFDVACRHKELGLDICSEYRLEEQNLITVDESQKSGLIIGPRVMTMGPMQIGELSSSDNFSFGFDPQSQCSLSQTSRTDIKIRSAENGIDKTPSTIRWSYGIWVF